MRFVGEGGDVAAVSQVSFAVDAGETLVILGESGSGKSVTAQAIMGAVPSPPGLITGGSIRLKGVNLLDLSPSDFRRLAGNQVPTSE